MSHGNTAEEIMANERRDVAEWKKKNKSLHTKKGESTRTHFRGTGTKLEKDKRGVRGYYHGTNVAKKDREGNLHFRTGGWMTPTTVRRMETFSKEHGGRDIRVSRAKGRLTAFEGGKAIAHSGQKGHEHIMTVKARALAKRTK